MYNKKKLKHTAGPFFSKYIANMLGLKANRFSTASNFLHFYTELLSYTHMQ